MPPTLRRDAGWIAAALLAAFFAGWAGLRYGFEFSDYDLEASAAVARLLEWDVAGFLAAAPAYGGSLILRAPSVFATSLLGGGETAAYRALAVPGLLAIAIVAAVLAAHARRRGWGIGACLLVIALAVLNPAAGQALEMGHPEELLGAALCVGAVMFAIGGRWVAAGLLLGLAVANKQWALVAVLPVLLALPSHRMRAGALAAVVAAVVMAPLILQGSGVQTTAAVATSSGGFGKPLDVWWFAGDVKPLPAGSELPAGTREPPAWVSLVARPVLVLIAALLSVAWWWRRRRLAATSALGLLALVLLVRCLFDPWTIPYYHLPFVLALLAWEAHAARRLPWATLAAAGFLKVVLLLRPEVSLDALSAAYSAVAVPGAVALAVAVLAPARGRKVMHALRRNSAPTGAPDAAAPAAASA